MPLQVLVRLGYSDASAVCSNVYSDAAFPKGIPRQVHAARAYMRAVNAVGIRSSIRRLYEIALRCVKFCHAFQSCRPLSAQLKNRFAFEFASCQIRFMPQRQSGVFSLICQVDLSALHDCYLLVIAVINGKLSRVARIFNFNHLHKRSIFPLNDCRDIDKGIPANYDFGMILEDKVHYLAILSGGSAMPDERLKRVIEENRKLRKALPGLIPWAGELPEGPSGATPDVKRSNRGAFQKAMQAACDCFPPDYNGMQEIADSN